MALNPRPKRLGGAVVAISPSTTTLRTTPANGSDFLTTIHIANENASAAKVWVYVAGLCVVPGVEISAAGMLQITDVKIAISAAETITAKSTVGNVTVVVSGAEFL